MIMYNTRYTKLACKLNIVFGKTPINKKPICVIAEYANSLLSLAWFNAPILPTNNDDTAVNATKGCNLSHKGKNGPVTSKIITPNVAIFGTIAKKAVTIVGAPS